MRRRFIRPWRKAPSSFLLALATLSCLLHGTAFADPDPATLIRLATSVIKVEVIRAQGGYSIGSGVVIGAGRVATNCHVTRDASQIAALQDGLRLPAQSQQVDAYHDLCVLHIKGIDGSRAAEFGRPERLAIGQPVTAVGHTAGMLQGSGGEVLSLHRMDGARVIQTSNFFSSGASGGGLFDADFKLVGILTFRLRGGNAHYFATPVDWLAKQRLEAEPMRPIGPIAGSELAFWERPAATQPLFLQAAVLEAAGNWRALQPLAADWAQGEADDAEPWYLLGLALSRQGQLREARLALECSLAIQPDLAVARSELERVPVQPNKPFETNLARTSCRH